MIKKLEQKDYENWSELYNGYTDFYKVAMNTATLNAKKLYDKIANNTGFELYELKRN